MRPEDSASSEGATSPRRSPPEASEDGDAEDSRLLSAFKNGDAKAFEKLLARHRKPVFNFCFRMLQDRAAAEDAFQEVFLRVVRSAHAWERNAKVTTWIYTIARNHCIDALRRARYRKTASLDQALNGSMGDTLSLADRIADTSTPQPDRGAESARMRERLVDAIAHLSEEQREVFAMREYAGMQFKDIARVVGVSENTVKSRMRYALDHLRKQLLQHGIDEDAVEREE